MKDKNLNMSMRTLSEEEVSKVIKKLRTKSAKGLDDISVQALKTCHDQLLAPLTYIINSSIVSGVYPKKLKESKISPLYKGKGSKTDPSSYRPVTVSSVISRILESCVEKQLRKHFERNNILDTHQHGFRKHRSTSSALIDLLHYVQENRNKDYTVGSVFIDLSSAFDLVDHKILLHKLKLFGVSRAGLEWIKSFLQDRSQVVAVKDSKSTPFSLDYGLPQGSPLSPLLYLIYVADAHLWGQDSFNAAFADDFNYSCIARSREEVKTFLQTQSKKVKDYFENNRLLLNPKKN